MKQLDAVTDRRYPDLSIYLGAEGLSRAGIAIFVRLVYDFYEAYGRSFAWRHTTDPYAIMVSEIMLQQTQTYRVQKKFDEFMEAFPTVSALACARVNDVVSCWQGLGYNRRALALQRAAQRIVSYHQGCVPDTPEVLSELDGIGPATAASIGAFAFNKPTIFIETNIRAVFIYTFFQHPADNPIKDSKLLPLVKATLDVTNPRRWYYALMDYGVALKKACKNPSRRSVHYVKQSPFEGSERQIRGMILKILTQRVAISFDELCVSINRDPQRVQRHLDNLCREGFLYYEGDSVSFVKNQSYQAISK